MQNSGVLFKLYRHPSPFHFLSVCSSSSITHISSLFFFCIADLRPLPDVAMTGNCTHECTEFGHSDSCWMPGQPSSPSHKAPNLSKSVPKLSTFVPYHQDVDPQETMMANGSPKPAKDERNAPNGGSAGSERGGKVANMRFMAPYNSAYTNAGDSTTKDCGKEEIPLSQAEYHSATTPTGQTAKREIYL